MTSAEKELWKYLRWKQFLGIRFRRQFWFGPYILDFYAPQEKICIEIDGDTHTEDEAIVYDGERTRFLISHKIRVIRYTNVQVYQNIFEVLEDLWEKIRHTPPNLP